MVLTTQGVRMGCSFSNGAQIQFLSGDLDTIGVRDGIFTQAEVNSIYNGGNGRNPLTPPGGAMMQFF